MYGNFNRVRWKNDDFFFDRQSENADCKIALLFVQFTKAVLHHYTNVYAWALSTEQKERSGDIARRSSRINNPDF